jgi:hypothetical protein
VLSFYLFLVGFGELSVCALGCVLPGSWSCGASLTVAPRTRFMIWFLGGGSLFEMTSSPFGAFVKVVTIGQALCDRSEDKKKAQT